MECGFRRGRDDFVIGRRREADRGFGRSCLRDGLGRRNRTGSPCLSSCRFLDQPLEAARIADYGQSRGHGGAARAFSSGDDEISSRMTDVESVRLDDETRFPKADLQ
jgi:hypothetical protein